MNMKYDEIYKALKKDMKPSRYKHTMGVVETAGKLAEIYGYDVKKAKLAALLHDCAKGIPDDQKVAMCREYGVSITDAERRDARLCIHANARSRSGIQVCVEDEKFFMRSVYTQPAVFE